MERRGAYLEAIGRSAEALKQAFETQRRARLASYRAENEDQRQTAAQLLDQARRQVEDRKRELIDAARGSAEGSRPE
jgi:hypothetical protein